MSVVNKTYKTIYNGIKLRSAKTTILRIKRPHLINKCPSFLLDPRVRTFRTKDGSLKFYVVVTKVYYNPEEHPFHLVDRSPWPFFLSMSVFALIVNGVGYLHNDRYNDDFILIKFFLTFLLVCAVLGCWFKDIITESTFEGHHTNKVQIGLKLGMLLFIVSEVMFFFAFFWAFFHSSLVPAIQIGCVWPPQGIITFNPWAIPFLNTVILLSSGATVTVAHYSLLSRKRNDVNNYLLFTIILGFIFTLFQAYEYKTAPFDISDSIYGSTFYLLTGFHGFHVIIGTIFLFICFLRQLAYHFTSTTHLGFEFAAWYWHFVDVVWIFLFICVYWWGS